MRKIRLILSKGNINAGSRSGLRRARWNVLVAVACLGVYFAWGQAAQKQADKRRQGEQDYSLYIMMNPVEGTDAEFNRWYDQQHVPDLLKIPGFVSAQRFALAETQFHGQQPRKYMVVFQLHTNNLAAVYAEVNRRLSAGINPTSSTLDRTTAIDWTFVKLGPEQFRDPKQR